MSIIATAVKHMLAAGLPHDQIVAAVEDMEASMQGVHAKNARQERNARYYQSHKDRLNPSENRLKASEASYSDTPSLEAKVSPTPPSKTQSHPPPSPPKGAHGSTDYPPNAFDAWYADYPNKVGRGAALKAFDTIRRGRKATFAQLVDGRDRYIRSKPPDRSWCNPATWLNQQRWLDEPDEKPPLRLIHGQPSDQNRKPTARDDRLERMLAGAVAATDGS
jgi:hypothetical protein